MPTDPSLESAVELHVEEYGEGEPAVVLLHGFAGSARNFRPQARALKERHRVVLLDLRGHARSPAPEDEHAYTMGHFVADTRQVVERLGTASIVLGGISMGAAIALRYALRYPTSLRGLVLASYPSAAPREASSARAEVTSEARLDPSSAEWATALADAIEARGAEAAGAELVWGGPRFDASSAKFIRQGFLEHPPHALVATLRNTLAALPPEAQLAAEAASLHTPTLLIAGENDARAVRASRVLESSIPSSRLVVIEGAGHVVNLEKPQSFNKALSDFLSRFE